MDSKTDFNRAAREKYTNRQTYIETVGKLDKKGEKTKRPKDSFEILKNIVIVIFGCF